MIVGRGQRDSSINRLASPSYRRIYYESAAAGGILTEILTGAAGPCGIIPCEIKATTPPRSIMSGRPVLSESLNRKRSAAERRAQEIKRRSGPGYIEGSAVVSRQDS
jgi:hypothetical protein